MPMFLKCYLSNKIIIIDIIDRYMCETAKVYSFVRSILKFNANTPQQK